MGILAPLASVVVTMASKTTDSGTPPDIDVSLKMLPTMIGPLVFPQLLVGPDDGVVAARGVTARGLTGVQDKR